MIVIGDCVDGFQLSIIVVVDCCNIL